MSNRQGRTVALTWPGTTSGSPPDVDIVRWTASPDNDGNQSLTAVVRIEPNPAPILTNPTTSVASVPSQQLRAQVLIKINIYTLDGVLLTRNVVLTGTIPRTLRLPAAQSISITAALIGPQLPGATTIFGNPYPPTNNPSGSAVSATVTAVVSDHEVDFLGQDSPVWNPSNLFFTTPAASPIAGPGNLLACQGTITNLGGVAALYLCLFDLKDAYVSGFNVTAGGTGYTSAPAVSYTNDAAGIDTGAAQFPTAPVVFTIAGGIITGAKFAAGVSQNAYGPFGLGMFAAPLVTLTGGGFATPATLTANVSLLRSSYALPVIGPFTSAPLSFSFEDELKDALSFESGLGFFLSSDPNNLTLVTGASARIDWKVAQ